MKKIVVIGGSANHGKDTFGKYLKEQLEQSGNKVLIMHFADYLKYICKQYFQWNGEKDIEGRTLLQFVGTDRIRSIYPNFWVENIENFINIFKYDFDYFILPDFRFKNEYWYFKDLNYPIISMKINRIGYKSNLTLEQQSHPSETGLNNFEFDFATYIEEGLENVENAVERFIKIYQL